MSATSSPTGAVLVVDDDPEVLAAYDLMLSASGLTVRTARNAREAMAHVKAESIPVCLVDLHLGETDGIQLCVELRAWNPLLRCIIITAYPAYDSAVSALKLGIADYLSKAEAPSRILAKVQDALAAQAQEQLQVEARDAHGLGVVLACHCEARERIEEGLAAHDPAYQILPTAELPKFAAQAAARAILLCHRCAAPHGLPGLLKEATAHLPEARLLVFNCDLSDEAQQDLLEQGVRGFLAPGDETEQLQPALEVVLRDHFWISRSLTARVLSRLLPSRDPSSAVALETPLSPRELEILRALTEGLSNQEIGDRLFISESTVKIHVHRIFRKLGVKSRTQALLRTMELKLV